MWDWLGRHKLLVVLGIAVVARLAVLLALPAVFNYCDPEVATHGSVAYDEYARNLLETGVYGREPGLPDAGLPPLYSLTLALVYRFFGCHYLALGILHIFFDALSIALLYDICRRLFRQGGAWIGALAAAFFALYPYLIFQNLTLNDTALWILLLHLFLWLLILLWERERFDRVALLLAGAAGIVLGVSALARALLPPLALLAVFWFLLRWNWRETLRRLLPVALISLLVLLPWMLRGYQLYGGLVLIALNSGENIYQGNNQWTAPVLRAGYDVQWLPPPLDIPPREQLRERNDALAAAGWRYLRENPAKIPELLLVKFQVYWNVQVTPLKNLRLGERLQVGEDGAIEIVADGDSHVGVTPAVAAYQEDSLFNIIGRGVHIVYFGGLWLLAIAGAWWSRREWRALSLLFLVQISQTAMYLLFHPSTRYRSPTDPLLFVFSAYALVWLARWWRGRSG